MSILRTHFRELVICWLIAITVCLCFLLPNRTVLGPDEGSHYMTIAFYYTEHRMPKAEDSTNLLGGEIHQPPLYYILSATALQARDLGIRTLKRFTRRSDTPKQQGAPPLLQLGKQKAINRAIEQPERVRFLRLCWIPFNALIIVLTLATGLLLFPEIPSIGRTAALFHLFLPQFGFISSVINNDHLANLIVAIMVFEIARMVRVRPPGIATAIRIGLWAALCFWIKLTTLLWVPILFAALCLRSTSRLKHLLTAGSIMSVLGLPIWIYNLWVWHHPFAFTILFTIHKRLLVPRILSDLSLRFTCETFFGAFGVMAQHRLPAWQYVVYCLVIMVLSIGFFRRFPLDDRDRARDLRWLRFFWISCFCLGLSALIHFSLKMLGGDQGRYLFTNLGPLSLMLAEGARRLGGRRYGPWVCASGGAIWIGLWLSAWIGCWLPKL